MDHRDSRQASLLFSLHISRRIFCVVLHFISENVSTVPALSLHLWHSLGCPVHYACFNIINKMHVHAIFHLPCSQHRLGIISQCFRCYLDM